MLPSAKRLLSKNDENKEDKENQKKGPKKPKRPRVFPILLNQFIVSIQYRFADPDNLVAKIIHTFDDWSKDTIDFVSPSLRPHISFTAGHYTCVYPQVRNVMAELIKIVENTPAFHYCLSKIDLFYNENKSRYFMVLCEDDDETQTSIRPVNKRIKSHLIQSIHRKLDETNCKQMFPIDPARIESFKLHTSIANFAPKDLEEGKKMAENIQNFVTGDVLMVHIDRITIQIGSNVQTIILNPE